MDYSVQLGLSPLQFCWTSSWKHKAAQVTPCLPSVFCPCVENVDLQPSKEDLCTHGLDSPLLWRLGQIQPACGQHYLTLTCVSTTQLQTCHFVNTFVWKLLWTLCCIVFQQYPFNKSVLFMILMMHLLNSDIFPYIEKMEKHWDVCKEKVFPVHTEQMRLNLQCYLYLPYEASITVFSPTTVESWTVCLEWQGMNQLYFGSLYLQYCHNAKQSHKLFNHRVIQKKSVATPQALSQKYIYIFSPRTHSLLSPTISSEDDVMETVKISSASTHTGRPEVLLHNWQCNWFHQWGHQYVLLTERSFIPLLVHKSTQSDLPKISIMI